MPVTADKSAPYAPAATIIDIVKRYRDRGLPMPLSGEALGRIGVPDSLVSRVLYALTTLDLIDADGAPTPTLEGLRLAAEAEFKPRQEEWLRSAYADIFSIVDPTQDDETRIRDAFRNYQPVGQQSRMVTLFVGLCANAGMMPEKAGSVRPSGGARSTGSARSPSVGRAPRVVLPPPRSAGKAATKNPAKGPGELPPAVAGLLESLPDAAEGWTKDERTRFMTTFEAVLDFCIPVVSSKVRNSEADADV